MLTLCCKQFFLTIGKVPERTKYKLIMSKIIVLLYNFSGHVVFQIKYINLYYRVVFESRLICADDRG